MSYLSLIFVAVVDLNDVLMANAAEDFNLSKDTFLLNWLNELILLVDLYCIQSLSPFLFAYTDCCVCAAA